MTMPSADRFGALLRRLRTTAHLTLAELAERASLSVRGINDLERGARTSPRAETVRLLADALGLQGEERTAFMAAARRRSDATTPSTTPLDLAGVTTSAADATELIPIRTFLIAGVQGYTHFTLDHGDEKAVQLAARFANLTRQVVTAQEGRLLELRGDEALVVFTSARRALRTAAALQEAFELATAADSSLPLAVGIGLDAVEAVPVEGGYRGAALNLAAQLCTLAVAGETLASETVIGLARKVEGLAYEVRAPVTLKGFTQPVRYAHVTAVVPPTATKSESPPDSGHALDSASPPERTTQLSERRVKERTLLPVGGFLGALPEGPVVGREVEVERIGSALDAVVGGAGRLLLFAGEAGVGKTRLAQEAMVAARQRGFLIAAGRCYEPQAAVAYYPFLEALYHSLQQTPGEIRHAVAERWPDIVRLLPKGSIVSPDLETKLWVGMSRPGDDQQRLFWQVTSFVQALAAVQPIAILLDDLHWADDASLGLLAHLARHTRGDRVLLLGVYRDVEVTHRHPLEGVLRDLGRERLLERIAVHRLLPEGTLALIGAVLGTNLVSEEFARLIHDRTEGNPFFTGELLRDLIERGAIYRDDASGRWERHEIEQITIPAGVRAVIGQRIGRLAPQTQEVLTEAAVLGQGFTFDELAGMMGGAEHELESALEEAIVAGLIREERGQDRMGGAYAFAHVLIQQTLYSELTARRRRRLHLAAGEIMERLPEQVRAVRSAELAWHFEAAGDVRAVTHLVNAAQRAATLFAYDHAADFYTRALTTQESYLEDNLIERFQLLLAREALYDRQGRRAEQAEDVTALVALAEAIGDPTRMAVAYKRQAGYFTYTHRYDEAQRIGERTLALYSERGDRLGEAQTLRELGFLHWSAGDYGQALLYGRLALQLHRVLGDVSAEATALHNLAEIYRGLGSPQQALQLYGQALNLHWASKDQQWQGLTLYGMGHALRQLGKTQAALERYQQALAASVAAGDRLMVSRVHQVLASILWDSGPADQVLTHLHQALSISQEIGYGPGIAHGLSALGIFAAQRGDQILACQYFEEASIWLRLTEDQDGLSDVQNRLLDLSHEPPPRSSEPPVMGWVKSHLALAEGKVYCEFESPLARIQR